MPGPIASAAAVKIHAALRVVAHDLHDELPRLFFALDLERAEERLADGSRAEGLLELDGLDLLARPLALRLVDHLHEVRLHDLARDRREVRLHVVERIGVLAHDVLRQALHHLLQERARALQDRAGELVDGGLLGGDELLPLKSGEVERLRVPHRGGEARALVGLAERREVGGDDLAEESDLAGRIGVRGGVEDLVEVLAVELRLEVLRRRVLVRLVDDAALRVGVRVAHLEDGVDELLDVLAALVRHGEDEVVELRKLRAEQLRGILEEQREILGEVLLRGGDGEGLAAVGLLELGVEDVHHLAEAVLHGVGDLRRAGTVDKGGILDDLGERDDVPVGREDLAHRLALFVDRDVTDHRVVGEHEVRDEVLDAVETADVVQRLGDGLRRLLRRHGLDDLVDVADDGSLDDDLAVDRLLERDVRHVLEHLLHFRRQIRILAVELRVVGVEQRLRVADLLAAQRALGHLHEDAGVVVALDEGIHVNLAVGLVREDERGELAREARPLARDHDAFEITVVHGRKEGLCGGVAASRTFRHSP